MPSRTVRTIGCMIFLSGLLFFESTTSHPYALSAYGQKSHLRCQGRGVFPTEGSCRFTLIVLQQTTQSFLATHNSVIPARPSIRQGEKKPSGGFAECCDVPWDPTTPKARFLFAIGILKHAPRC